ncbi:uncharacterized protein LOC134221767 [Armigeres subalbatus]|uniref:uncharacterized protein LOC134221767 n=1 Tax=Armigeres subalbatus TaxID=124917 RepID=UPI002ED23A62
MASNSPFKDFHQSTEAVEECLIDYDLEELEELEDSGEHDWQQQTLRVETNMATDKHHDLFFCTFLVYKRQFKGQSSGTYVARWEISAGSKREFIRKIWLLSEEYLAREVVFVTSADGTSCPSWSSSEKPVEDEFHKFALFQSGRRNYTLDKLNEEKSNILQSWRGKDISLFLHIYSLSVSSRSVWNSVKDVLIDPEEKDRSGAAMTHAVFELADELRAFHCNNMDGHGMAWSFWANTVLNAPAHLRETMKDHPPQHLAHLFRAKEGMRVEAMRRELHVVHSVNNSFHEEIAGIRQVYNVLEAGFQSVGATMEMLKQRIEALEIRDKLSESLISAMETSVNVQEDLQGKTLSLEITDVDDTDHM